ncbi:MAG: TolC family protein [Candidatus Sericytochromatia bacterium]
MWFKTRRCPLLLRWVGAVALTLSCLGLSPTALWATEISVSGATSPTPVVSLQHVLQRVEQDNPELAQLRQEQALWESRVLQAGLGPNPELSLVGEDFAGSAAWTADRFTQLTLGWAQLWVLGDKAQRRVELARINQRLGAWHYRVRRQELLHQAYRGYAELLGLRQQATLLAENRANAEALQALLSRSVAAGKLAPSTLWTAEQSVRSLETAELHNRLQFQARASALASLWGDPGTGWSQAEISADLAADLPDVALHLESRAALLARLPQHPRLARWQTERALREAAVGSAEAQAVPDLNLSGGLRYHPPQEWGLVMSVGVPLTLANANQGQIAEARLHLEQLQAEQARDLRQLQGTLLSAHAQASGQLQLLAQLRQQLDLALLQQQGTQKALSAGKITALEALLQQEQLFQLRRQLAEAEQALRWAQIDVLAASRELAVENLSLER